MLKIKICNTNKKLNYLFQMILGTKTPVGVRHRTTHFHDDGLLKNEKNLSVDSPFVLIIEEKIQFSYLTGFRQEFQSKIP